MSDLHSFSLFDTILYKADLPEYLKNKDFMSVCNEYTDKAILNKQKSIDERNKRAGLGGLIGEKKYWGSTAFTEGMELLIEYAFNERKFLKIESGVYENNAPCIIASKKVGFKLEGIRKCNAIINGKPCDTYLFGIINKKNEKYSSSN